MKLRKTIRIRHSIILFLALFLLTWPMTAAAQGKIAFSATRDGNIEIYLMNPNGSGQTNLTNHSANDDWARSLSGNKIVFSSNRDGHDQIYVMNSDGTGQTRLSNNLYNDFMPSSSPDGSKIVFVSNRDGNNEIYVMNSNGSGQTRLTNDPDNDYEPSFGPGGRIVFVANRELNYDIYVMNSNGTGQTRLTTNPGDDLNPSFRPDGNKIAFASSRGGGRKIFLMDANGTGEVRLTDNLAYSDDSPSFSPDGSRIAFQSGRDGNEEIYVMNANGTSQTRLTNNPAVDGIPGWLDLNAPPTITTAAGVTSERDAGVSNSSIATVNDVEDAENTLGVTVNGAASATSNGVTVSGIAVSSSGNVTASIGSTCGATAASFTLRVTDSGTLFDEATLNVAVTDETVDPTLTLPPNIVVSLPMNSTDTSAVVNFTVSAIDNCDPNPTVTAVPASGSTFPVGTTTVNVVATDVSGNTAMGSFTVTVSYNFAGFFEPIYNVPIINTVSGGQSIPVKFSLSGDKGLDIFATGYPASQQIECGSGAPIGLIEYSATPGSSSLTYDAAIDRYLYVWQTARAWRQTCRRLIVRLNDGSEHTANFQFK